MPSDSKSEWSCGTVRGLDQYGVCVCVCVYVCERERKKKNKQMDRDRKKERETRESKTHISP